MCRPSHGASVLSAQGPPAGLPELVRVRVWPFCCPHLSPGQTRTFGSSIHPCSLVRSLQLFSLKFLSNPLQFASEDSMRMQGFNGKPSAQFMPTPLTCQSLESGDAPVSRCSRACPGAHPGCQVSVVPAGDSAPHGLTPGASGASRASPVTPVGGDEASRSPKLHPVHQPPSCPFTAISHSVSMTVSDLGVRPGTPEPEDSGTPAQLVCLLAC